jgi:hypothetical protein
MVRAPHPGGVSTPGSWGSLPFHCLSRRSCRRKAQDPLNGWSSTVQALSSPRPRQAADAGVIVNAPLVYSSTITYRDITVGNNGAPCLVGFDLSSGLGSWIGTTP